MIGYEKPYIIGETAFHHEGDSAFLRELVQHAIALKLDAIKFHLLLDLDDYMAADHAAKKTLSQWCIKADQWDEILSEVQGIDVILLCNDVRSVEYATAVKREIAAIEIHATGLNDIFLLERAAKFPNTVILGTGGSSLDEIEFAVNFLKSRGKIDVLLMHGFQNYPTEFKDIKLERMNMLSRLFRLPVGYADHTDPEDPSNSYISCLGIANGHNVIEKHFTHHYGEKRIDAQSAISLEHMSSVQKMARITHETLGSESPLELSQSELKYGNTGPMKKALVARTFIKKGEQITLQNIAFKRTNDSSSLKQLELAKILNTTASQDIESDEIIDLSKVEYVFVSNDISQFNNTNK